MNKTEAMFVATTAVMPPSNMPLIDILLTAPHFVRVVTKQPPYLYHGMQGLHLRFLSS